MHMNASRTHFEEHYLPPHPVKPSLGGVLRAVLGEIDVEAVEQGT